MPEVSEPAGGARRSECVARQTPRTAPRLRSRLNRALVLHPIRNEYVAEVDDSVPGIQERLLAGFRMGEHLNLSS